MKNQFEIAGGTVLGTNHQRCGKNNQDAFLWQITEDAVVIVVADGCGSKPHSEVGAKIGSQLIVNEIITNLYENGFLDALGNDIATNNLWSLIERNVLEKIYALAHSMDRDLHAQAIADYFLFTMIGAIATKNKTIIFSLGDGAYIINGEVTQIGPFPDNAPPYLAYQLLDPQTLDIDQRLLHIKTKRIIETPEIKNLLIGTDGVCDLIRQSEKQIPGSQDQVGQINWFWENDKCFSNPDMIRRRLSMMNRQSLRIDEKKHLAKESGILPDDTTLVVMRQKKGGDKM
ncbi:MAG: protein phosphatase 2C domain-containing protein [Candidatus Paceibacterota bacterium]|jgi:hypothetical protein